MKANEHVVEILIDVAACLIFSEVASSLGRGVWSSNRCSQACSLTCPGVHAWWNVQSFKCFVNSLIHIPLVPVLGGVFGVCVAIPPQTEEESDQEGRKSGS